MPILVKVNCELNGSFELRMYPCSECNVLLMKPARWKKCKRPDGRKKNSNHWWCSVHPVLQPTFLTPVVLLWLQVWVRLWCIMGCITQSNALWIRSIKLLTLNFIFPKWRVADISFVENCMWLHCWKCLFFSVLSPIRRMSRSGLSDTYFLKGPTNSIVTSESVLLVRQCDCIFPFCIL